MASKITIDLCSVPIKQAHNLIGDLINRLQGYIVPTLKEETCAEITKKIIDNAKVYANIQNATAPKSGTTESVINSVTQNNIGAVWLEGPSAIYDEFGTGTEGANNPHPLKSEFGLNPYNSGPTIFYNQFANKYQWVYRPMAGRPYFTSTGLTEGIPSGKQMYNTLQYIRGIEHNIAMEEVNNTLKELK